MTDKYKKIAFLFLIYDKIDHEELWFNFFSRDLNDRYSIYIHYKYDVVLEYFEKYKLTNCISTKWGDISLVKAQNLLLNEAMKDDLNDRFIFCSGTCVPLKSFNHIYNKINPLYSYFNMCPDNACFPRCNATLKYINRQFIKKASQWCILNRKHVTLLLSTNIYLYWFKHTIGDEHCYISYLHYLGLNNELIITNNLSDGATTFTNWTEIEYKYSDKACTTSLKNYKSISIQELLHLINSPCIIGRKFLKECDLLYLYRFLDFLADNTYF